MTACTVAFDADELLGYDWQAVAAPPARCCSFNACRTVEIRSVIDPTMAPA